MSAKKNMIVVVGVALCLFAASARAVWLDGTKTYYFNSPTQMTDFDYILNLPQFDPAVDGGRYLTAVDVSCSSDFSTSLQVTAGQSQIRGGTVNMNSDLSVSDPQGLLTDPSDPSTTITMHYVMPTMTIPALSTGNSATLTAQGSQSLAHTYTDASLFEELTGTGSVPLEFASSTMTELYIRGGNWSADQTTVAGLNLALTYHYKYDPPDALPGPQSEAFGPPGATSSVPEPTAASLLILVSFATVIFVLRSSFIRHRLS